MSQDFSDLVNDAIKDIQLLKKPVIQVCGPISTGGFGAIKNNLDMMQTVISYLRDKGFSVFDQTVYEKPFSKIVDNSNGYDLRVLEHFYKPLFEKNYIDELIFLPDWQSSFGASWEHEVGKSYGLKIHYW